MSELKPHVILGLLQELGSSSVVAQFGLLSRPAMRM